MREDQFEFENPRRNPYILEVLHLALTEQKFALNGALLAV